MKLFNSIIKFILFLLCVSFSLNVFSQNEGKVRMIYLWDVTLSMQGKSKGCPDIWDEVKTAICNDIKRMNDESTEVIILPFQHRAIVESMVKDKATFQGKQRLIEYIKGYELPKLWLGSASNGSESKDGNTTMTAIYQPFKYCMDSLLHKDKKNIVEFLTDGRSDFPEDEKKFNKYLLSEDWCSYAKDLDVRLYYVALTKQGVNSALDNIKCDRITPIPPGKSITTSIKLIQPQDSLMFNVHDDYGKELCLRFKSPTSIPLEKGYKINVRCTENPFFEIDETVVVNEDLSIKLRPKYKCDSNQMKQLLDNGVNSKVEILYEKAEGMNSLPYEMVDVEVDIKTIVTVVNTRFSKVELRWE